MKAPRMVHRVLIVILATALLALSGTMALAAANDYRERGTVSSGVTVLGYDLGGMSESQARESIKQAVATPLQRPVTLSADNRTWTFDPKGAIEVDVDGMLAAAYSPRREAPFVSRIRHDVAGTPMPFEVKPLYTVDPAALESWVASVVAGVDRPAVDASITLEGSGIKVQQAQTGRKVDADAARKALSQALSDERALEAAGTTVELPVAELAPKVTEDKLGKTIVVDLSERRIRLFDGATLEKSYRCAIGTPDHPTPRGTFKIVNKRYMPTWNNPGSEWAKSMPKSIPPGPSNPLGTRALNLNASGIRIHGTTKIGSIGSAASHGCMRMVRHDIEDLYPRVPIGTTVYIVR